MFRNRLLALLLALSFVAGPALAAAPCGFNNWLVDVFNQSEAIQASAGQSGAVRGIADLATKLAQISPTDLRSQLRQHGLGRNEDTIVAFVQSQHKLVRALQNGDGALQRDSRARATAGAMRRIIAQMECAEDPSWGPVVAASFAQAETGLSQLRPKENSASGAAEFRIFGILSRSAGLAINILVLLMLGGLGIASVLLAQRLARKSRPFTCNIPCRVKLGARNLDATIVDISQIGAKLRLDTEPTHDHKLTIRSDVLNVSGRVAWHNHHYSGLIFSKPLGGSRLALVLARQHISARL